MTHRRREIFENRKLSKKKKPARRNQSYAAHHKSWCFFFFQMNLTFCLFEFRSRVPTLHFRAAVKLFDTKKIFFFVNFLQIHHSNELIQVSYYLMH